MCDICGWDGCVPGCPNFEDEQERIRIEFNKWDHSRGVDGELEWFEVIPEEVSE